MKTITEDESEAGGVGKQEQQSMTFLRRAHKSILGKKKKLIYVHNRCVSKAKKNEIILDLMLAHIEKQVRGKAQGEKVFIFIVKF